MIAVGILYGVRSQPHESAAIALEHYTCWILVSVVTPNRSTEKWGRTHGAQWCYWMVLDLDRAFSLPVFRVFVHIHGFVFSCFYHIRTLYASFTRTSGTSHPAGIPPIVRYMFRCNGGGHGAVVAADGICGDARNR